MTRLLSIFLLGSMLHTANAALVDHGSYTTDTTSGLDWLKLSTTAGLSYTDSLTGNPGWRLATNMEVESLFGELFDGYYDTNGLGFSRDLDATTYSDQIADVANFFSLFGYTYQEPGFNDVSLGFYQDEDEIWRIIGVADYDAGYTEIIGLEHYSNQGFMARDGEENRGTLLVRTSIVPIPAAIWLLGSALFGLTWLRKKR